MIIKGVSNLYSEKEIIGSAAITKFIFKDSDNPLYNARVMFKSGRIFRVEDGEYVRLHIDKDLVMSDTHMERLTNMEFVNNAKGRVMIAGLGIGLIINAIIDDPLVTEILVVEKNQDVIDIVSPKFKNEKLKIVCADIFEYKIGKSEKFDTIYFDIWTDIMVENIEEIKTLHRKFRINKKSKESFMGSWMHKYLLMQKKNGI